MNPFLTQLLQNLASIGIDIGGLPIDHIAYRASSIAEGDTLRDEWSQRATLLKTAIVNGREVLVFECQEPLVFHDLSIPCFELMYPRPSRPFGGWDHIEAVLGPYSSSIDVLRERLLALYPDIERNSGDAYSYEEDGLHAVSDQAISPDITIRFPDKTAVRFHTADIREIIAMER